MELESIGPLRGVDAVLVPLGSWKTILQGKREWIRIIAVGPDKNTPHVVREALVGLTVCTVLSWEQLPPALQGIVPRGACLAYASEVLAALKAAKKEVAVQALIPLVQHDLDVYAFEDGTFELVEKPL